MHSGLGQVSLRDRRGMKCPGYTKRAPIFEYPEGRPYASARKRAMLQKIIPAMTQLASYPQKAHVS
ncbi:hypothetical protein HC928_10215 [bacterium]|nr:hypothetical protein [bacterium]